MIEWPGKVHEWVALFGGVFGTVLSVANFAIRHRRDRAVLHFSMYDDDWSGHPRTKIYLAVSNIGRRPINITAPFIYWRDGTECPMDELQRVTLMEQDMKVFEESLSHDRSLDDVLAFVVTDSGDKDYWYFRRSNPLARFRAKRAHRQLRGD